jgi:hypothetical protein
MLDSVFLAAADDKFAAWMVLSGVIVGGLITFCTQCGLELLRAQIQGCQLAGALAGELKGFKEIMFVWQVKGDLKGDLESMTNNKKAAVLRTFEADESFLIQVFLKNTEKIGLLPYDLSEKTCVLYTLMRELIRELRSIPKPVDGNPQWSLGYTAGFVQLVLSLIEMCQKRSDELIPKLEGYARFGLLQYLKAACPSNNG